MRPSQLLAGVMALSSLSAASIDFFGNLKAAHEVAGLLYPRDDSDSSASSQAASTKDSASSASSAASASATADSSQASETGKATASDSGSNSKTTGKATGSQKSGSATATKSTHTSFDARLPAGGVSMVTPNALSGAQYYKIGDWVTFAWNYTSLSVTPSAIDVLATCTANQATYTLAVNQSVQETGVVLWDTGAYQSSATVPLLTETYTLIIYDAESSVSATAAAGYLGTYNSFTFGMYSPQPYTPWSDYHCPTCSGAMTSFEKMTLKALFLTCGTTIASIAYFTYTFGLW